MQTITFPCVHCGNLMAVGLNLLGRNVRCPHCKQVLQAPAQDPNPAPAPPAPIVPPPSPPSKPTAPTHAEVSSTRSVDDDIFEEGHDEDVFGSPKPKVIVPEQTTTQTPVSRGDETKSPPSFTLPDNSWYATPNPLPPTPPSSDSLSGSDESDMWPSTPAFNPPANPVPMQEEREPSRMPRSSRVQTAASTEGGTSAFTWILLLYSIGATGAVAYLAYDKFFGTSSSGGGSEAAKHPFLEIPDFFGEYDRAKRREVSWRKGMPEPDADVPAELRVGLKETIQVGELKVTPVRVEYRPVTLYRQEKNNPVPKGRETPIPVYLLTLEVENVSKDLVWHPNDPAFCRRTSAKQPLPYDALVVGQKQFPGGWVEWPPKRQDIDREYIEGQEQDHLPLAPGEKRTTVVCTGLDQTIPREIERFANASATRGSSLLWRVQLRSGQVTVTDPDGKSRDIGITSVIGVTFTPDQIK